VSDAERFFKGLEEGELPPVIAMGGPERAFVDDALRVVRERALAGAIVEFNHDRVAATEVTCDGVIGLAQTLPTMAPRRLVEVHDADALKEGGSDRLDAYLDQPAKETVLLFLFGETMDARGKLVKSLKKRGAHMARFDHPRERDMPGLVRLRARRQKLMLSAEAAEAIAVTVGTDLVLLDRALEKLTLVAEGREVSLEDIYEHVADTHLEDAFRLTRSLSDGDRAAALKSLAALEAARDEPLRLLGLFELELWEDEAEWAIKLLDDDVGLIRPVGYMWLTGRIVAVVHNEVTVRSLSYIAGMAQLPLAYLALRRILAQPWIAVLGLLLLAIHPVAVAMTKEFKPYALESTLHVLLVLLALEYQRRAQGWRLAASLVAATVGSLFAWTIIFLYPAVFLIVVERAWRAKERRHLAFTVGAGALTLTVLLAIYLKRISNREPRSSFWGNKYTSYTWATARGTS
jgi:DNA polymerase-3 subunit delta